MLYYSSEASDKDRRILKNATTLLAVVVVCFLALIGSLVVPWLNFLTPHQVNWNTYYPAVIIILSTVGIGLTLSLRQQITSSSAFHERHAWRHTCMPRQWPTALRNSHTKDVIMTNAKTGLCDFFKLFEGEAGGLGYERIPSKVHSENDLYVQCYITAMTSWDRHHIEEKEIRDKSFMVGLSHWLDDLVDGKEESRTFRKLYGRVKSDFTVDNAEVLFERLFKTIITKKHTDEQFYDKLIAQIKGHLNSPDRRQELFFSLNRVAVGSVIFSPRIKEEKRKELLEEHSEVLGRRIGDELVSDILSPTTEWRQNVRNLIQDMCNDPTGLGGQLLGLTTKTVQEMAMACEKARFNFTLSLLYSILYAPLLYYHDINQEVEFAEITPVHPFETNIDGIQMWLQKVRTLIDQVPSDNRSASRFFQMEMAYSCFKDTLPQHVDTSWEKIFSHQFAQSDIIEEQIEEGDDENVFSWPKLASLYLDLSMIMANVDGELNPKERTLVIKTLQNEFGWKLKAAQKAVKERASKIRRVGAPNDKDLRALCSKCKRFTQLNGEFRVVVFMFLRDVAASDRALHHDELECLQTIALHLGIHQELSGALLAKSPKTLAK
jgi:uncharacterized tellurite resistance protein B-like protein